MILNHTFSASPRFTIPLGFSSGSQRSLRTSKKTGIFPSRARPREEMVLFMFGWMWCQVENGGYCRRDTEGSSYIRRFSKRRVNPCNLCIQTPKLPDKKKKKIFLFEIIIFLNREQNCQISRLMTHISYFRRISGHLRSDEHSWNQTKSSNIIEK